MALAHPERIEALIVQDAVRTTRAWGRLEAAGGPFWADRTANESTLRTISCRCRRRERGHVGSDPK